MTETERPDEVPHHQQPHQPDRHHVHIPEDQGDELPEEVVEEVHVPAGERVGIQRSHPHPRRARRALAVSVVVAVLTVLAGEIVLRALPPLPSTRKWNDNELDLKSQAMSARQREGTATPVAAIGSSVVDAALDPAIMGQVEPSLAGGYNAATEGADGRALADWARNVVGPRLHPDVLVIGLTPRELNRNGVNQKDYRDAYFSSRGYRIADGKETLSDRVTGAAEKRSEMIRVRGRLREPYNALLYWRTGGVDAWEAPIDEGTGHLLRHVHTTTYTPPSAEARNSVYNDYEVSDEALAELRSSIEALQRQGTTVVILQPARVEAGMRAVLDRRSLAAADAAVAGLAKDTCAPLIDLRDALPGTQDFADSAHVNGSGTRKESTMVAERLAALPQTSPGC